MTLIAGFRCSDGIVMCADTQETVEINRASYRVSVQKIERRDLGNFEVAIGGSGTGDLIDAFIAAVEPVIRNSPITALSELKALLHTELYAFMKTDATLFPRKYRPMKFVVSARSKVDSEVQLWKTAASQVVEVGTHILIGWDEALYKHVVDQLYTSSLPINQAILLGIRLFELAESTSNYVKGPISVILIQPSRMSATQKGKVDEMTEWVRRVGVAVDTLLLVSTDMNAPHQSFEERFAEVQKTIQQMRNKYQQHSFQDAMVFGDAITFQLSQETTASGTVTPSLSEKSKHQ